MSDFAPSLRFMRGLQANLDYWCEQTADLNDTKIKELNRDFPNVLQVIEMGLVLPQTREATAVLILQCFFWVEGVGHIHHWQPHVEKILTLLPAEAVWLRFCLLKQLGQFQRIQRDLVTAVTTLKLAESLAHQLADQTALAEANINLAQVYQRQRNYKFAEQYGLAALDSMPAGEQRLKVIALETLGYIAQEQGQQILAEKRFRAALSALEGSSHTINIARTKRALAINQHKQQHYETALQILRETEDLLLETAYHKDKIEVQLFMGNLYYDWGNLKKAKSSFHKAEQMIDENPQYNYLKAQIANNLGCVLRDQEAWLAANVYFQRSISLYKQVGDDLMLANVLGNLGKSLMRQDCAAQAIRNFEQAVVLLADFPENAWARELQAQYCELQSNCSGFPARDQFSDRPTTTQAPESLNRAARG